MALPPQSQRMPQLPSGQYVAVDPKPLHELLKRAGSPSNAHYLMRIEQMDDPYRRLDVLTPVPAESLRPDQQAHARRVDAAPPGLIGLCVGRSHRSGSSCASPSNESAEQAGF